MSIGMSDNMSTLWTIIGAIAVVWLMRPRRRTDINFHGYQYSCSLNGETFVYRFTSDNYRDVLRVIGQQAADPRLPLEWSDAAELGESIC